MNSFHWSAFSLVFGAALLCAADPLPANDPAWKRAINLIPLIDPQRDALTGTWTKEGGSLVSKAERRTRSTLQIPYEPSDEYDFRIVFTRSGGDAVIQILTQGGHAAAWWMGIAKDTLFGFSLVNGNKVYENETTVRGAKGLEDKRRYTSVLQIRKTEDRAYLDGKLITRWRRKADYSDAGLSSSFVFPNHRRLGIANQGNSVIFHAVELLEVTGKGKLVAATGKAIAVPLPSPAQPAKPASPPAQPTKPTPAPAIPAAAPEVDFAGVWKIKYTDGSARTYEIDRKGGVWFAEEDIGGQLQRDSQSFMLDLDGVSIERLQFTGDTVSVERFGSRVAFATKAPILTGTGKRTSRNKTGT